jgi:hypothetical protein
MANGRTPWIILVDMAVCQYLVRDDGAVDPFLSQQPGAEVTAFGSGGKVAKGGEVDEILLLTDLASGIMTGAR